MVNRGDDGAELRWESRLWTLFQIGLVALVGYLALQSVEAQKLMTRFVAEQQYANHRLAQIESQLDRLNNDRYLSADARRDWDVAEKRFKSLEDRLNAQAAAIQDLRRGK